MSDFTVTLPSGATWTPTFVKSIDQAKCIGCTLCARKCPVNAIAGERQKPHRIIQENCIKCGECLKACEVGAVSRR